MLFQLNEFNQRGFRPGVILVASIGLAAVIIGLFVSSVADSSADARTWRIATFVVSGLAFAIAVVGAYSDKAREKRRKDYLNDILKVRNEVKALCKERKDCMM